MVYNFFPSWTDEAQLIMSQKLHTTYIALYMIISYS